MIHTITYVSSAVQLLTQEELVSLLKMSRDRNAEFDITGMLLYKSGNFIQTIEGPKEAILRLYSNIRRDRMHHSVITLIEESIQERHFPNWQMGFINLTNEDLSPLQAYSDILQNPLKCDLSHLKAGDAKTLLLSFSESTR